MMEALNFQNEKDKEEENVSLPSFKKRTFFLAQTWVNILHTRSTTLSTVFFVIEAFQLLHFAFILTESSSSNSLLAYMKNFFELLALYPSLATMEPSALVPFVYGSAAVPILTLAIAFLSLLKPLQNSVLSTFTFYIADFQSHILYLPLLGILSISLTCQEISGTWVSKVNPEVKCYNEFHVAFAVPAMAAILSLIILATLYKAVVFKNRMDPNTVFSKQSSIMELKFHFIRSILCVLSIVLPKFNEKTMLLSVLYICSTLYLSWECMDKTWLYNKEGEYILRLCWGFNAWSGIAVLLLGLFYKDVEYYAYGLLFTWPMILALIYYYLKVKKLSYLVPSYGFKKDARICMQACIELSRLIAEEDKETLYLLDANIEAQLLKEKLHDSPVLTSIKEKTNGSRRETSTEIMVYLLNKRVRSIIAENPNSSAFKIFYIKFLIKHYHSYSLAWVLSEQAARLPSSWTEQFLLYGIRKELALQAMDNQRKTQNRTQMNAIIFLRQAQIETKFRKLIERAAHLYNRFWDLLQEKSPSCEQFEEVGFGILRIKAKLSKSWKVLTKSSSVQGDTVQLYAKFTLEIDQDKSNSRKILESLSKSNISTNNDNLMNYAGNGTAVVSLVGKVEGLGKITRCNKAFASLIGYPAEYLENVKITKLMPKIYRKAHKQSITQISAMLDAGSEDNFDRIEKEVFILHRSMHLIPVILKIMEASNLLNNYSFIATVTVNKRWNQYTLIHLLLDLKGVIIGATPNIKAWLNLRPTDLSGNLHITSIIPDLTSDAMTEYRELDVICQDENMIGHVMKTFLCRCEKVTTSKGLDLGYHVFLRAEATRPQSPLVYYNQKHPLIQFEYDQKSNKFYTRNTMESIYKSGMSRSTIDLKPERLLTPNCKTEVGSELSHSHLHKSADCLARVIKIPEDVVVPKTKLNEEKVAPKSVGWFHQALLGQLEIIAEKTGDSIMYEKVKDKSDYAKGIVTYRIEKKKWVKVSKKGNTLEERDTTAFVYEELSSLKPRKGKFGTDKIIRSTIKTKDYLIKLLQNMPLPSVFNRLAFIVILCITIASGIGVAEYVILKNLFMNIYSEFDATLLQFRQGRNIFEISTWITQLIAVKDGYMPIENAYPPGNKDVYELGNWTVKRIEKNTQEFSKNMIERENAQYAKLLDIMYSYKLNHTYSETDTILPYTALQMAYYLEMDTAHTIANYKYLSDFSYANPNIRSFEYNYKNHILTTTDSSLNDFVEAMIEIYASLLQSTQLIVYICVAAVCILVPLQLPFIFSINSIIKTQAALFLQVPLRECRIQQTFTENFLSKIKETTIDSESLDSDLESIEKENISLKTNLSTNYDREAERHDRSFTYTLASRMEYAWRLMLVLMITLGFVLGAYFMGKGHYDTLAQIERAMNNTVRVQKVFFCGLDMQMSYFVDPNYPLMQTSAGDVVRDFHSRMYDTIKSTYSDANEYASLYPGRRRDTFETYFFRTMCVDEYPNECLSFPQARRVILLMNVTYTKGYGSAMVEFLSILKSSFLKYRQAENPREFFASNEFAQASNKA